MQNSLRLCFISKKVRVWGLLLILLAFSLLSLQGAELKQEEAKKPVRYFYSSTCGQCHQMMPVMEKILKQNKDIAIEFHEIDEKPEIWEATCLEYGIPVWGVPRIFIGDKVFAGWFEYVGNLLYVDSYNGYLGYRNQVLLALESYFDTTIVLQASTSSTASASLADNEDCGC